MNPTEVALLVLLAGHIVLSGIAMYDLFTISKRRNKPAWLMFLIVVPYLSVFLYSTTKRRPGRPGNPTKINV